MTCFTLEKEASRRLEPDLFSLTIILAARAAGIDAGMPVAVKGYVLDSACAFIKNLDKPIGADCVRACAKAGSPLVILADDGTVYWPIAATTPSSGQNEELLPFAGQKVTARARFSSEVDRALWSLRRWVPSPLGNRLAVPLRPRRLLAFRRLVPHASHDDLVIHVWAAAAIPV